MRSTMTAVARRGVPVLIVATGVVATTQHAGARPATFHACTGSYTTTMKSPQGDKWKNTVSQVTEQGTTCTNAHALAGAFARANCGECSYTHHLDGYTFKNPGGGSREVGTKGNVTVKFHFVTKQKGAFNFG